MDSGEKLKPPETPIISFQKKKAETILKKIEHQNLEILRAQIEQSKEEGTRMFNAYIERLQGEKEKNPPKKE